MRRSLLFIPGNNPSMLQNADVFAADAIIIDLEDSVMIEDKDAARNLTKQFMHSFSMEGKEVMVRINGLDTNEAMADLEAVCMEVLDAIVLPKATKDTILALEKELAFQQKKNNLSKTIKIIPIIEKATSLLESEAIASHPLVDGLLLGAEDFATDMEVERTEQGIEILYARSYLAVVGTKYGLEVIDTPYTNVTNEEGLQKDAEVARSLGLKAKACIHPNQVDIVNEVFSPTKEQIESAIRIQLAIKKHPGKGAFQLDGKMIDKPIIDRSKKVLERAIKFGFVRKDVFDE